MMNKWIFMILLFFLCAITFPYLFGWIIQGKDLVFTGFIMNIQDGNSYLAKMQIGYQGLWQFRLPYTANPGEGTYLFLFYIFLGQISRLFHLPIIFFYHLIRLFSATFLFLILMLRIKYLFPLLKNMEWGQVWIVFGAGLGWIGSLIGVFSSDYWVAEAFPFLSSFATPHFTLGLAILIIIVTGQEKEESSHRKVTIVLLSLILSIIMPFGVVVALLVVAGYEFWKIIINRKIRLGISPWLIVGGFPFLIYQFYIIQIHPILKVWNFQNQTPSPTLFDFALSFLPALGFAVWGGWKALRCNEDKLYIYIVWFMLGVILIYIPFNLQRRFIFGLYVPIVILAMRGLIDVSEKMKRAWLGSVFMFLSIPTNFLIIVAGLFGCISHNPAIYLTTDEYTALVWIKENLPGDAVILSSPEMGKYIPAQTGRRVVYGHPFETAFAEDQKILVDDYFKNNMEMQTQSVFLKDNSVDLIFYGPREQKNGETIALRNLPIAYKNQTVTLYIPQSP
jgi:hypothetical protein